MTSPVRPAPALDPEAGATWRTISDAVFEGKGMRLDAETLDLARSFELTNRERCSRVGPSCVERCRSRDRPAT